MKYRIKDGFVMNRIADEYTVIPRGPHAIDFASTLVFNEAGAFLWKALGEYTDIDTLAKVLSEKYSLDIDTAKSDTAEYVEKLKANGLVDEQ